MHTACQTGHGRQRGAGKPYRDAAGQVGKWLYDGFVRRLWAALLVLVFSVPLIPPLLAHQPERKLPSCCRRDGKHGCGMMAHAMGEPEALPGTPGIRGAKPPCPLYPSGKSTSAGMAAAEAPAMLVVGIVPVWRADGEQPVSRQPLAVRSGMQKRGPPSAWVLL